MVEHFRQGAPLIAFSLLPYEQKVNQRFVGNGEGQLFFPSVQHFAHCMREQTFSDQGIKIEKSMMVMPKMSEPV